MVMYLFNLVYLMFLVELVVIEKNVLEIVECVVEILSFVGMFLLKVCKEIDVYIVDWFFEVVWWEVFWLVKDGIVIIEEIDELICMVFGICWV